MPIIISTTSPIPTIPAIFPLTMESEPSEGPTLRSSTMCSGAGRAPARSTSASSEASSMVALPSSICPRVLMAPLITGAVNTRSSSTIAILSPMCSPVERSNRRPAVRFSSNATMGRLNWSVCACAFCRLSPVIIGWASTDQSDEKPCCSSADETPQRNWVPRGGSALTGGRPRGRLRLVGEGGGDRLLHPRHHRLQVAVVVHDLELQEGRLLQHLLG